MTHTRRKPNSRRERKRVLRLMKKLTQVVKGHAQRYRKMLDHHWEKTQWSRPQAEQVLRRIENVLALLPQAIEQAHERIIGQRLVGNKEKLLSLYETDARVIVRGKEASEVEFGNTLLLGESRQGLIVDWRLFQDTAPADCKLIQPSVERVEKTVGGKFKDLGADRGFDDQRNVSWLADRGIYNGICPRSAGKLRERMREKHFSGLQQRRSQTEGRIGIFKNQFLGRPLRVKGFAHRQLAVAWGVLTHNLWVIARLPQADQKQQAA